MKKIEWGKYSKLIILVVFISVLTVLRPKTFPTVGNIANVLWSVSVYGIMVCGTIFVFLVGGIDLSIGSLCGLCAVIAVRTIHAFGDTNIGVIVGIIAALAAGAAAGVIHGLVITKFAIPAFLVTFATQSIFLGLSMVLTSNKIISCLEPKLFTGIGSQKVFGFPLPIYVMVGIGLISWYILRKTVFGREIYAIGGNAAAARISGVNDTAKTVLAYVFSGLTTAIGGVVLASMTQQSMASTGSGYETEVITAGVIGGVSLLGGEGTVPGAIFGAILIGLLNNGLNLMSVPSTVNGLVKGMVIIIAVGFDAMQHQDQSKKVKFNFRKMTRKERS